MVVEAKICGLTRPEDAAWAAQQGAARLGVVFAWGPRVITAGRARDIVAAADGVPVIGVVGAGSVAEWLRLAEEARLSGLQLHGGSTAAEAAALRSAGLEVWRVASVGANRAPEDVVAAARQEADVVLVEPHTVDGAGGRGVVLDPLLAARARAALATERMALAGGLTPDTVAEAIRLVGTDLVDVSSGVESSPGIKDKERVARFLEAVRDAGSAARRGR